jgi:hypothetical protein
MVKVARMVGLCEARANEPAAWFKAQEDRKAELASRAICGARHGPMSEPRRIAGVQVYCAPCGAIWEKTGKVAS